jgi:preprotein translocase subunit SecF
MGFRIYPDDLELPFVKWRNGAFALSLVAIAIAIGAFAVRGLNFGVDFRGGTLIEISTPGDADLRLIRSTLGGLGLGDVQVSTFGAPDDILIRVELQDPEEGVSEAQAQQLVVNAVIGALSGAIEGFDSETMLRRSEVVSGTVSRELVRAGAFAVFGALVMMLAYIWFRFEWQFSVGAVLALTHDVTLTIGMFSITQIEFNLSIIAAILTIVGYSMNDTVVVYDRIRENLRKYKKLPLPELLNGAINQTLSRTTMTSFTTLLALFALFILGGEVLRGFAFAMIFGIFVGTYSSIFVAAPLLILTGVKRDGGADAGKTAPVVS